MRLRETSDAEASAGEIREESLVLNAWVEGAWCHPETSSQMSELFDHIMRRQSTWFPGIGVGDFVALSISDDPFTAEGPGRWPDNSLQVRVNSFTGYGGLIWHGSGERIKVTEAEEDRWCWVSDNPSPPGFDPLVLSDPGGPFSFDPRSALPAAKIRAAMEEFSRTATGERPTCVRWVHGEFGGGRHDQEQERTHGNVTEPLRQAMLPEPAKLQVLGAMRLLRMLPVLSAAGASIAPEVTEICEVRGRGLDRSLDEPVRILKRFDGYYPESDEGPDHAGFRYARMVAVGIALALAREDDPERRFGSYEYSHCSFWSMCHTAVLKPGTQLEPHVWDVATRMRDAEEACRRREIALLLGSADAYRVFRDERANLAPNNPAAVATAQAVVRCAGWEKS